MAHREEKAVSPWGDPVYPAESVEDSVVNRILNPAVPLSASIKYQAPLRSKQHVAEALTCRFNMFRGVTLTLQTKPDTIEQFVFDCAAFLFKEDEEDIYASVLRFILKPTQRAFYGTLDVGQQSEFYLFQRDGDRHIKMAIATLDHAFTLASARTHPGNSAFMTQLRLPLLLYPDDDDFDKVFHESPIVRQRHSQMYQRQNSLRRVTRVHGQELPDFPVLSHRVGAPTERADAPTEKMEVTTSEDANADA